MLYVLIPLALGLLGIAVWALLWAIKSGQFDDLESHGWSVVLDDDQKPMTTSDESAQESQSKEGRAVIEEGAPKKNSENQHGVTGEPAATEQERQPGNSGSDKDNKRSSE